MFTNSISHFKNNNWKNIIEVLTYACVSTLLIGHILFIDGIVNYLNAAFVMLGIVCATLAIYLLTPISNWLSGKDVTMPAEIILFPDMQKTAVQATDSDAQRAA